MAAAVANAAAAFLLATMALATMAIQVTVKLDGLDRLRKAILGNPALGERIAKAWATIYRAFVRQRFAAQSRGGGEWAPLALSTIKRRRGGGQGAAILRDTGALFASLQPNLEGAGLLKSSPLKPVGFRATLQSARTYKAGATLQEVAEYHHHGEGRLPARTILVAPPQSTIAQMAAHGKRIMVKAANER